MAGVVRSLVPAIIRIFRVGLIGLYSQVASLLPRAQQLSSWLRRNFGNSMPCTVCVSLGVWSTNFLPITTLSLFLDLPNALAITISPIAALAIAALVVDKRAYQRWRRARRAEMGLRMLRAYADGLLWMRWCIPLPRRKKKISTP